MMADKITVCAFFLLIKQHFTSLRIIPKCGVFLDK